MTVLYLDTSSSYFYASIYQDGKILGEENVFLGKEMSSKALPQLKALLEKTGITPSQVDRIMIVDGPGSFTGIRIGMTIAKVYAWTLEKEIVPISGLLSMTLSVPSKLVLPILDARRGYVFGALYQEGHEVISKGHYRLEELLEKAKQYGAYTLVSNDTFEGLQTVSYQPNYKRIIEANLDKTPVSPHLVNPVYLKRTEAEENLDGCK